MINQLGWTYISLDIWIYGEKYLIEEGVHFVQSLGNSHPLFLCVSDGVGWELELFASYLFKAIMQDRYDDQ